MIYSFIPLFIHYCRWIPTYSQLMSPGLASHRHADPLVPVTGHEDMVQSVIHSLYSYIVLVCVRIDRKAKFFHGNNLGMDSVGDKAQTPVLR